ncbi:MAG: hypothetical protein M1828_004106 [Chrysothrix sp. TS-e1954]|nr:MAG: hypothetical protein M1828_004106 [Chrysothrix sp. TS-e1954]
MVHRPWGEDGNLCMRFFSDAECVDCKDLSHIHKAVLGLLSNPLETLLRNSGGLIDRQCSKGYTALAMAAQRDDASALELLLRHGADASISSSAGATPLHHAAWVHSSKCLEILIAHGAQINALSRGMRTPLFFAIASGSSGAANTRTLLAAGADALIPDVTGMMAIDWALRFHNFDFINALGDHEMSRPGRCDSFQMSQATGRRTFFSYLISAAERGKMTDNSTYKRTASKQEAMQATYTDNALWGWLHYDMVMVRTKPLHPPWHPGMYSTGLMSEYWNEEHFEHWSKTMEESMQRLSIPLVESLLLLTGRKEFPRSDDNDDWRDAVEDQENPGVSSFDCFVDAPGYSSRNDQQLQSQSSAMQQSDLTPEQWRRFIAFLRTRRVVYCGVRDARWAYRETIRWLDNAGWNT